MEQNKILVVEDEPKLNRLLYEVLSSVGYTVTSDTTGKGAIEKAALEQPDLIILDIVLSDDIDGYEVADKVREFSDVPIIMLTAKARESDLLKGFNAGADDYLTKPFSSKELLARVRAVLKRSKIELTAGQGETLIACGDLKIDQMRRHVTLKDVEIRFTRTEYNLLLELAKHRNQVLLHEHLLQHVWGTEYRDDVDYLRAYIRYLRRKIEADPADPKIIITHQGVGYEIVCPE